MNTVATPAHDTSHMGWFSRSEAWLDSKGKGAWIAAMVLGFVFFWPVGLALLFYMIWSKRMFSRSCGGRRRMNTSAFTAMRPTGNMAFDNYKADTLQRLEEEQQRFEDFLQRLREARDKAEFDQFMDERADAAREARQASDEDQREDA